MESSTTIKQMLAGNKIFVPSYQRAYSWDIEVKGDKVSKQVNTFLSDLEEYDRSATKAKYYFGHFLFQKKSENEFGIIDGQQRLTTIVIFLSVLFKRLKAIRSLSESEDEHFEDMIKRKSTYRFETVDYDRQFFRDYVIDQTKIDTNGIETESAKRMANAFEFFSKKLAGKDENYLLRMLDTIQSSSCTTHPVADESEAIQMFIFQNNRGKKPSNLEIIKAQFMFAAHIGGGEEKECLIEEIKSRFEKIYKSISFIEYRIDEDDVLLYTLRVHFNSLWETNVVEKVNRLLSEDNSIPFIKSFTQSLATSFEHLTTLFGKGDRENFAIHSLVSLGRIGVMIPFIIKAYKFALPQDQLSELCSSLESLLIRHRTIGTRANMISRLNEVYQSFHENNPDIKPIIDRIEWMKNYDSESGYWAYWNNKEFRKSLQGEISHPTAILLLWKYENYLDSLGKGGYKPRRFDSIKATELEHIAPQTDNPDKGYDTYDDEFRNQHMDCIGNYLLLSKSHNCSISNGPFAEKRLTYKYLEQQREIQEMTKNDPTWTREHIRVRKEKIINVLLKNC